VDWNLLERDGKDMKKTLLLCKNELNYELRFEDEVLITIIDKKITGESIYDKVYIDVPANAKIEVTIEHDLALEEDKIKDKEDKLMFDQIKELFKRIDKAISDAATEVLR